MGEFKKAEVSGVLRMLFPDKTKEEVRALAKKVYKKAPSTEDSKDRKYDLAFSVLWRVFIRMRFRPTPNTGNQTSLAKRLEMTSSIKQLIDDRASPDSSSSSGIDVRR